MALLGPQAVAQPKADGQEISQFIMIGPGQSEEEALRGIDLPGSAQPAEPTRPKETASQVRARNEFTKKIDAQYRDRRERAAAADFPSYSMSMCHNAPYPRDYNWMPLDHWVWCKSARGVFVSWDGCTGPPPGNGCTQVGAVDFRLGVMGHGHQGQAGAADRKVKFWMLLDEPKKIGEPRLTDTLSFVGNCRSDTPGTTSCNPAASNGRSDTIAGWMAAGYVDWEFSSPEAGLADEHKLANFRFSVTATTTGKGIADVEEVVDAKETPFRCDSATYQLNPVNVRTYGCVFTHVSSIWTFKAAPDVAETAKHVWTAQNKPDLTRPPAVAAKNIPGSVASVSPLTRLAGSTGSQEKADATKNRNTSIAACQTNYGPKYASFHGARDCDEYPMASTRQGAYVGDKTSDKSGTSHFSVRALTRSDNQAAGRLLVAFYLDQRVINGDDFYVDVVAADGSAYPGLQEPSGVSSATSNRQCDLRQPEVSNVKPSAPPEKAFLDYSRTTPDGWTGGDSTFSVDLPDGRRLFLFSDTFLGPLNSDGTRPTSAPFINSSFLLQDGSQLTTLRGGTKTIPRGLMTPAAPSHWYWLGDGHIHTTAAGTSYLQILFQEYYKFGPGNWDFKHKANFVAWFELTNLGTTYGHEPVAVDPLPSTPGVGWGSAVLSAKRSGDGYTYIYGVDDAPTNKQMRVARVKGTNLSGDWEYLNPSKNAWMKNEKEAANVHSGIANEYSVTPWYGGFMAVSQTSTEAFSAVVKAWVSCSPHGPWQLETDVYRMPEPGPWGSYGNPNIFAYNAHVHDTLSPSQGPFTLSYNVNSFDSRVAPDADHYRDPSIYKPRFVSFSMTPRGGTR